MKTEATGMGLGELPADASRVQARHRQLLHLMDDANEQIEVQAT